MQVPSENKCTTTRMRFQIREYLQTIISVYALCCHRLFSLLRATKSYFSICCDQHILVLVLCIIVLVYSYFNAACPGLF